jgi:hypothetical protein
MHVEIFVDEIIPYLIFQNESVSQWTEGKNTVSIIVEDGWMNVLELSIFTSLFLSPLSVFAAVGAEFRNLSLVGKYSAM